MEEYYRKRAEIFEEEVYHVEDLDRQKEMQSIAEVSKQVLNDKDVLDVACGTGYWARIVSETARSIVGIDFAQEMLKIASQKQFKCPVSLCKADAFNFPFRSVSFNGGMADFWFSHVPREKTEFFLQNFHRLMKNGSMVLFVDNVYVPGIGGELVKKDGDINTYKLRNLDNKSEHLILKNYFSADELIRIFSKHVTGFSSRNLFYGKYYWYLSYKLT